MTLMGKAADGVTWHTIDRVVDFRLGACGQPLDLGRQVHHSLVPDHLRCQRAACSSAWLEAKIRRRLAEAGETTVAGVLLLAAVLFIAVVLGGVVPVTVWPWVACGGVAVFAVGCLFLPVPRRR